MIFLNLWKTSSYQIKALKILKTNNIKRKALKNKEKLKKQIKTKTIKPIAEEPKL